jgi:hypothetical protein
MSSSNCHHCKSVLIGYRIPHAPAACPLKAAEYCFTCFKYGHRSAVCPNAEPPESRTDSIYLTQTTAIPPEPAGIQVVRNEHVLAAYLRRHKIHPKGSLEDMMLQVYELAHRLKIPSTRVKFIVPPTEFKTLDD